MLSFRDICPPVHACVSVHVCQCMCLLILTVSIEWFLYRTLSMCLRV